MGLLDRLKDHKNNSLLPHSVDPKSIPPEKQQKDLEKLMEFEKKIKGRSPSSVKEQILSQHDLALKLKNPFRGV